MNHVIRCLAISLLPLVTTPGTAMSLQAAEPLEAGWILEVPRTSDSAVFLQRPVGATRFDDGTIAVVDGMAQTIWFFDSTGSYSGSAGRAGEGPNEFSTPGWLGRCGPGVATIWDFSLMRFTTFDSSGTILDQRRLQDVVELPGPPARLSCSETGQMLAR
jgi:hypothetical protein